MLTMLSPSQPGFHFLGWSWERVRTCAWAPVRALGGEEARAGHRSSWNSAQQPPHVQREGGICCHHGAEWQGLLQNQGRTSGRKKPAVLQKLGRQGGRGPSLDRAMLLCPTQPPVLGTCCRLFLQLRATCGPHAGQTAHSWAQCKHQSPCIPCFPKHDGGHLGTNNPSIPLSQPLRASWGMALSTVKQVLIYASHTAELGTIPAPSKHSQCHCPHSHPAG